MQAQCRRVWAGIKFSLLEGLRAVTHFYHQPHQEMHFRNI